ncbi:MmgE/PrpD family protein [Salipiger abyssi]|uniref:MmgE/PrpD family protein n=1 Tax=Salipiger abyssi TaxID=1250539 RepID=UPI004058A898
MTAGEGVLGELAGFVAAEARWQDPALMHHAKRAVIDWLAAIFPGTRYAPSPQLVAALGDERGQGRSSLVGIGSTAFAASAAWVNGTASHAAELDDIYREAVYHPGSPTVAAALAVAEDRGASGADFLRAVAAGYEVAGRVGAAVQPAHSQLFHATGTLGCLGAATAAAMLLSPGKAEEIGHAIATAASFASGLQEAIRAETMTKPIHAGHAAAVGVRAAQAAAAGVTGAMAILDGPVGFAAALAGGEADWSRARQGLGDRYVIASPTHKLYACCGHLFPVLDAVLALRAEHGIAAEEVAAVEVTTYQAALDATARHQPRSAYEGKFSMPYVIAHALVYGSVGIDAFEADRVQSPELRALMARCTLSGDPEMSAAFPSRRPARVRIVQTDGRAEEHALSVRRGDPEAPLSDAELTEKYLGLAAPVIGAARAQGLLEAVWRLEATGIEALGLAEIA